MHYYGSNNSRFFVEIERVVYLILHDIRILATSAIYKFCDLWRNVFQGFDVMNVGKCISIESRCGPTEIMSVTKNPLLNVLDVHS